MKKNCKQVLTYAICIIKIYNKKFFKLRVLENIRCLENNTLKIDDFLQFWLSF